MAHTQSSSSHFGKVGSTQVAASRGSISRNKAQPAVEKYGFRGWGCGLVVGIATCLMMAACGCGSGLNLPASGAGGLLVSPGTVDFGSVTVGQSVNSSVSAVNQTSAPMVISQLSVAGPAFSVASNETFPVTVPAGSTHSFKVGFAPASTADYSGQLTVMGASAQQIGHVPMHGRGQQEGTPQLTVSAGSLNFSSVAVNSATTQSVTLTSTGTVPVTVSAAAITGAGFTFDGGNFPLTLSPNQSITMRIQFRPMAAGAVTGQLTISSNSSNGSTAVVVLDGTGTAAAANPQLTVSAASLNFNNVTVNSGTIQAVTLTSTGGSPVTISAASITGAGFSCDAGGLPVTLNPGQAITLRVQFLPTTAGTVAGQLTISSNSLSGSTALVALSGTGTAVANPQLTVSTASLSFSNVTVNSATTQAVTLVSTGTSPVTINSASISGVGFTIVGGSFPVTLNPGQTVTLQIQFLPTSAGTVAGQLTINSDSSSGSTAIVALSGTGTAAANPQLTVSTASLSFGSVTVGSPTAQAVTLTSTGTSPVTISAASITGAGFTILRGSFPLKLDPNQAVTLQIQFLPTAAGTVAGQMTINSDSSSGSTAIVTLGGTGTAAANPQLTLSTASLSFSNVTVNSATTQAVTLTSTGTSPVTISAASIAGGGFTIVGGSFPVTLDPNQAVTLQIQFLPTATGTVAGQLTINSNSSTGSTAVVALSGTGTAAANPQLTVSTASLSFGSVTVNSTTTQAVTLTSTGTSPVTVSAVSIAGGGFTIVGGSFPVTLDPNQAVTLQIQFLPTATGAAAGQLTIDSDSSSGSTATVALSGTGTAAANPQLTVSTASLSFGSVTVNSATTQAVTLTSTGTSPVTINTASITGGGFTIVGGSFPVTLGPNQAVTLQIQFLPTTVGAAAGQLTISSNSSSSSTAVVSLNGTGIAAAIPQLTVSTASLSFGSVTVNSATTQAVTLTSTGTSPVTVSTASITGAGFTIVGGSFPVTLNPTQAVTLQIQFLPTATGAAAGQLTINSNSSTSSTAVVTLSGTGTAAANPQLTVSTASLSFGSVTVNSATTQAVTLTSTGTSPVTVNTASITGAGFTIVGGSFPVTLNPTQAVTLQIQFLPTATGAVAGQLTINSNSSTSSTAVVALSGTGTAAANPQLTVSTASLSFGSVTVNSATTQAVTLTSTGTSPVTVSAASITGAGFTIIGGSFPVTLNPNQTVTLQIQFKPTSTGTVAGQLTISSNSTSGSTAVVTLGGTGTAAANPQLTVSTANLSFGSVTVNSATTQSLTLTSTGTSPVTVNSASITGTGFTIVAASFPVTLNPNQSVTLQIQFLPTAAGAATGQVTISSNSTSGSTAVVDLSGTGTAANPQLTVSGATLSFGSVAVNTATTLSLTLTSTGTTPVTVNSASITGAGFTTVGGSFPVTLNPNQTVTLQVQFKPTTAGAVTGQVTISSNSTSGGSTVVTLSGTGTAVSHEVDLSWSAPVSSADPVAGYNIYRSIGGGSMVRINSSPTAQTVYVDSAVVSGSTYDYIAKSVDSNGVESPASNQIAVTIP